MNYFDRVERNIDNIANELTLQLRDVMMFRNNDGTYELYNKYSIQKIHNGYRVSLLHGFNHQTFATLRNALSWCIYDYRNKIVDCNRIADLDRRFVSSTINHDIHTRLLKRAKTIEDISLYTAKIAEDDLIRKDVMRKLEAYIQEAHRWQQKKFESKARTSV